MSPQEMIDRYVHDVARRLPWQMRGDVASELRGLLTEELAGESGSAAEESTRAMLVRFGAPAEVASRYYTAPPVIDPLDSRRFWQVGAALLLVIAVLRYSLADLSLASEPANQGSAVFWSTIAPMVGVLTMVFWAIGALRRLAARRPFDPRQLPPVRDPDATNRSTCAAAVVFFILGTVVLALPGPLLDLITGGRATPEALAAFAYDPTFLAVRAPWVVAGIALGIVLFAWAGIRGRWSALTRRIELAINLFTSVVLLWSMQAGPIFSATPTDRFVKLAIALIVAGTLVDAWWKWDRLRANHAQLQIVGAESH